MEVVKEQKEQKPTSSSAPEVVHPSDLPEVVREDADPKYVVDDGNGQHPPYGAHELNPESADHQRRRICGLSPKWFWVLVVVAVIVIAGAVGGGVGGALASNSNKNSASTTSAPSTTTIASNTHTSTTHTSAAATSSSTGQPFSSGCNKTNNEVYTPLDTSNSNKPFVIWNTTLTYQILCYVNLASKSSGVNPSISELLRIANVTSLDECITRCAIYNSQLPDPQRNPDGPVNFGELCSNVVYAIGTNHTSSECFLQSGPTGNASNVIGGGEIDTAVLQWPNE